MTKWKCTAKLPYGLAYCAGVCELTTLNKTDEPSCCVIHHINGVKWKRVSEEPEQKQENTLPKLTAEVFDRPDCPEWARYAALGGGGVLTFYEDKPMMSKDEYPKRWINYDRWYPVEGTKFDASDWKNSLIERPAKPLPDWCKVGAWVYIPEIQEYFRIANILEDLLFDECGDHVSYGDCRQARLRPYNAEEMKALVGKVVERGNFAHLVTDFQDDEGCFLRIYGIWYNAEELRTKGFELGNNIPCGTLEHLTNYGEWKR